ncbi:SDR family NAD(P)-dependent oxidoreductase [Sphingobium tyrosinilyticum]|uniref:SDR family NAD(P)-dependent oxidoreductase n=1 Tax=Sphingobium tyrosinilyticum TaxID=2715436 RepID=A0ABV9F1J1_9SPHN
MALSLIANDEGERVVPQRFAGRVAIAIGGASLRARGACALRCQVNAAVAVSLAHFGRLDCNAGVGALAGVQEERDEKWSRYFAINVDAIIFSCRAVLPVMQT